jgi:hypothetical protein
MEKQIGLWIDHKKAVIVTLEDGREEVRQIQSDLESHSRFRGGARTKTAYSPQFFTAETQVDRRFNEHLNKYYKQVIAAIADARSLFVFGAGEAKFELEKRLKSGKGNARTIRVENADKLTERQIAARVRRYFKSAPA